MDNLHATVNARLKRDAEDLKEREQAQSLHHSCSPREWSATLASMFITETHLREFARACTIADMILLPSLVISTHVRFGLCCLPSTIRHVELVVEFGNISEVNVVRNMGCDDIQAEQLSPNRSVRFRWEPEEKIERVVRNLTGEEVEPKDIIDRASSELEECNQGSITTCRVSFRVVRMPCYGDLVLLGCNGSNQRGLLDGMSFAQQKGRLSAGISVSLGKGKNDTFLARGRTGLPHL